MSDMEAEVEEVSFLPGEKILNKKAVYEPSSSQRCRQLVCSRGWAIAILVTMGFFLLLIAIIAAFARPGTIQCDPGIKQSPDAGIGLQTTTKAPEQEQSFIATNGQPFPWKDIRLPRDVIPDLYELFLHANISQSVFTGTQTIHATVVKSTDFVIFHIKDLNVTSVEVLRGEVGVSITQRLEYKGHEQYYVKLAQPLASNSKIKIQVKFQGTLENKLAGLYKSTYKTGAGETRAIATTHFEPTDARAAFPCFDEPDLKANFTVSLIREKRHIALSNMPVKKTSDYENDLLRDDFETSVKMSTYLVAFVICDFKNVSDTTQQGTLVRVFAPEDLIDQANYALGVAVKVLNYYNTFFGLPYPLPKQDMVAIPDFAAGAMENWGLITYRLTSILYDPQLTSASSKQWISVVVAHELAHQWFGNIVTMKWWNDLWLNEGFASFVENIGSAIAEPEFKMEEQFVYMTLQTALYLDSLGNSHPIQVNVKDPAQINEIFDKISYSKGASIIRMCQDFLGEVDFQSGLAVYLKTHAYSNAETKDLWHALQSAGSISDGLTVTSVMDTWTLQMGYPVVNVRRKPGSNQLTLTQERFVMGKSSPEQEAKFKSPFNYKWHVPFTYTTPAIRRTLKWLKTTDGEVTIDSPAPGAWIKGNVQSKGFYRVNYDDDLWRAIISQLKADLNVFTPEDRAGLIDDAFVFTRVGLLKYDILFELLGYLGNETHYVPWVTVMSNYRFITERMYLTDVYPQLQKYMLNLLSGRLAALGWDEPTTHLDLLLQESVLSFAVDLDDKGTNEVVKKKFDAWRFNNTSLLQNQRSLVVVTGVKMGDDEAWEFVWDKYTTSMVPTEQKMLLGALTHTDEPRRIQLFLRDSLNSSKVRSQDSDTVLRGFAATEVGHLFAWRFLQQNYQTYFDRYGSQSFILGGILKGVVSMFNTRFDYDEVVAFFKDKELGSGSMALKQGLETVQSHIEWSQKYEQEITRWAMRAVAKS